MKRSVLFMTVVLVLCPKSFGEEKVALTCPQWIDRLETVRKMIQFNLANVTTTRTPEGGPYKFRGLSCDSTGIDCEIRAFEQTKLVYQPGHPDASIEGYVLYPDIDVPDQLKELAKTLRALEEARRDCN